MKRPEVKIHWKEKNKKWKDNNISKWCKIMDENQKNFRKNNPDYMNKKELEYYYKNKEKWKCRYLTRQLFKKKNIVKTCIKCSSNDRIQMHHEIYPNTKEEIIKAIEDKKIYYLCHKCHRKNHGALRYF